MSTNEEGTSVDKVTCAADTSKIAQTISQLQDGMTGSLWRFAAFSTELAMAPRVSAELPGFM